jgi:hypothetical protein
MRRLIRWGLAAAVLAVIAVVGVSLLRGADTPPAPTLPKRGATPDGPLAGTLRATRCAPTRRAATTRCAPAASRPPATRSRASCSAHAPRFTARGRLTLHGRARSVRVRLQSRRVGVGIDLVGSTPIEFADYGMAPPSVAGVASVRDHGVLEVRLRLR